LALGRGDESRLMMRMFAEYPRRLQEFACVCDEHLDASPQRIRYGQDSAAPMHASAWALCV